MTISVRWCTNGFVALLGIVLATGCYTKLSHSPVQVEGGVVSTYRVDYRDDCASCHGGNPLYEASSVPRFYDNPAFYAWRWYYQVPWWADAAPLLPEEDVSSEGVEARDFSRRRVAAQEESYAPATVGGQSGMAPPVSKVGADNNAPPAAVPAPEPRRDFVRHEGDQSGQRQRQAKSDPPKETEQAKVKKQE